MTGTAERRLLGCSKRGDAISIGWKSKDREPIIEFIKGMDARKTLRASVAFEVDNGSKTRYDYLWHNTSACPDAHLGGGFMVLECIEGGIKADELLRSVYDLCTRLSHPRIWYDRHNYPQPLYPRGEYAIEETMAVLSIEKSDAVFGSREFAGVIYPSYAKVLGILEELTTPGAADTQELISAHDQIIRMIEYDAFCLSTHPGRTNESENWKLAQERMAARAIWYMNNPFTNTATDRWLNISGPLEMPDDYHPIDNLGMLDGVDRFHLLVSVLSLLKADDRFHLVRAGIPVEL